MYGGGQHGRFIVCTVSFQGPEQQQDRVATRLRLCQFNLVIHIVSHSYIFPAMSLYQKWIWLFLN